jgi:ParB-like nuclease domain
MSVGAAVPGADDTFAPDYAAPDELFFDEANPRLHGETAASQDAILLTLWREFAVNEIADSIAANGFFPYEPLFAVEEGGRLVVIEGNRRLAAVKLLLDPKLRSQVRATDLPTLDAATRARLTQLPYVACERSDVWRYIGFKHVNGPAVWDAMGKAIYISRVHNEYKVGLDDIARQIGDRHATVRRLYQGLMAVRQAENAGVFAIEDRYNKKFFFSHLYTGLGLAGIQKYLGVAGRTKITDTETPIPAAKTKELGDVLLWMYGRRSDNIPPLVRRQNPDLRKLDQALTSRDSVAAIRKGVGLDVAVDIAKGDDKILREELVSAKLSLQGARGRVVTGFAGERELQDLAQDIQLLADAVVADMERLVPAASQPVRGRR